jgi:hypothetical protein
MQRIEISQVKVGMKILEEDSYGNNVYIVEREAYRSDKYPFLVADFRDVETGQVIALGGTPPYEPHLYRIG